MTVHHTPVDTLSCIVTMILFIYLYMNGGYNPRAGFASNLPYQHQLHKLILYLTNCLSQTNPKPSLILCLTYTALVSGAEWRVVGTYIHISYPPPLKQKVDSENAYVRRRRWAAPITPRNHDGATAR